MENGLDAYGPFICTGYFVSYDGRLYFHASPITAGDYLACTSIHGNF